MLTVYKCKCHGRNYQVCKCGKQYCPIYWQSCPRCQEVARDVGVVEGFTGSGPERAGHLANTEARGKSARIYRRYQLAIQGMSDAEAREISEARS